jgi:dihydrofolate reductase
MLISLIAAMDKNHAIGIENRLPWHLPADLQHFKKLTLGKPVLMGRNTYESIGKPLPGRLNIVVTRNESYQAPGCTMAHSFEDAISKAGDHEEIMIIGGASFYEHALPRAHRLYLTFVDTEVQGDAFFPVWNPDEWRAIERESHRADEKNAFNYEFITLERLATECGSDW